MKHRILGDDGIIVLSHLGGKGIRTSTKDSESNKSSTDGNSNSSTSGNTSNQTKVKWADIEFVTWVRTSILGIIHITFGFGAVVGSVTVSGSDTTTLDRVTSSQKANVFLWADFVGVLASFGWMAGFVGTNAVIVTEDGFSVNTANERITSIGSTSTAIVTDNGGRPITSVDTTWLENAFVFGTQVSIVTVGRSLAEWIGRFARTRGTDSVVDGSIISWTGRTSVGSRFGNLVSSGLIEIITVTGGPFSPSTFTRSWAKGKFGISTNKFFSVTISMFARSSTIAGRSGDIKAASLVLCVTKTRTGNKGSNARDRADWDTFLFGHGVVSCWTIESAVVSRFGDNISSVLLVGDTGAVGPFSVIAFTVYWTVGSTEIPRPISTVTVEGFFQTSSFVTLGGIRTRSTDINDVGTGTSGVLTSTLGEDGVSTAVDGNTGKSIGSAGGRLIGPISSLTWVTTKLGLASNGEISELLGVGVGRVCGITWAPSFILGPIPKAIDWTILSVAVLILGISSTTCITRAIINDLGSGS